MERNGNTANIPAPRQNVASWTPRNARRRNSETSSIGWLCLISTTTKATISTAPATSVPTIWPLDQPTSFPRKRPNTIRKRAAEKKSSPATSVRTVPGSRDSRSLRTASVSANAPIGTFTKKIQRQLSASVMIPPSSGPAATASPIVEPQAAIAFPRSGPWYSAPISARAVANSAAPPTPCSARAASSVATFGAMPQRNDASVKIDTPTAKSSRRP